MSESELKYLLDEATERYENSEFIAEDPIGVPHGFDKKQDIEIAAFFAAILAWGQRQTIIKKCQELLNFMDYAPHDFLLLHTPQDLKPFENFKHRTFNGTDALYFIDFLSRHYQSHESLETAFTQHIQPKDITIENALIGFEKYFFNADYAPSRTQKHVATPMRKSACKRLCMFLRWMVRSPAKGVDFGIWKNIQTSQLCCPLDVHVARSARHLGLLKRKQNDWKAVLELTQALQKLDAKDPVKYDFALFGISLHRDIKL
ncbi:MAG: TIGR02757 family protein [Bernardetiaceae bacterium]|nr:TIGR02757 family protein [Bernardetiaceae bacterium]